MKTLAHETILLLCLIASSAVRSQSTSPDTAHLRLTIERDVESYTRLTEWPVTSGSDQLEVSSPGWVEISRRSLYIASLGGPLFDHASYDLSLRTISGVHKPLRSLAPSTSLFSRRSMRFGDAAFAIVDRRRLRSPGVPAFLTRLGPKTLIQSVNFAITMSLALRP